MKYVAFTADTEAYFCPPSFTGWQGVYTMDIVRVCEAEDIPFTWLIICDREKKPREFREIDAVMKTVWPSRQGIDEFGIHTHFKHFINDKPDDFVWELPERRKAFLEAALKHREKLGMPAPLSFRYGGGDSQAQFYLDMDVELLHAAGVRNFLIRCPLSGFKGLDKDELTHKGNNVWQARDMDDITVFSGPSSSMELETDEMIRRIDEGLAVSDYITVTCHDYTAVVPGNLTAAARHIRENHEARFVTINGIGEHIREGAVSNELV
ncbi:hypothetical protein ACFL4W_01875 [Planctomycetota bacterium]